MLARDMQSVVLYNQEGKFAGVRRPKSKLPIDIDGVRIIVLDAIGCTGLEIKVMIFRKRITFYDYCFPRLTHSSSAQTDPGVPIVYTGFGALMLTTSISLLSHTQV